MHKLIVTLTNHSSALEENVFDEKRVFEIYVDDPTNNEEIFDKAESKIVELRGESNAAIRMEIATESGDVFVRGTVKNGFHGVIMS